MSTSILHLLSAIAEITYGTTPTTPVMLRIPHTATNIALSKGIMESGVINVNRQVTDVRHGNRQVGGDVSAELIYGEYDAFFEALLGGTWTPRLTYSAGTISAASGDNSINDSATAFPAFIVGENVALSGFTGAGIVTNLGNAVVVSRTTAKIVLSGITLTTDAAGETVTLTSLNQSVVPGTTRRSFSILRQFTDLAASGTIYPFHLYKGCEIAKLSLSMSPETFIKADFGIFGREFTTTNAAPTSTTYTAASARKPFDSFTGSVLVDGSAVANITEINLTVENGFQPRFVLFDDKTLQPKVGKCRVTGTMTLYFADSSFLTAFNSATKRALEFSLTDTLGNTYTFDLPSILGTGAQADVSGEADIMVPFPFTAIYEQGAGTPDSFKITRDPV